jgi:thymidylate synthase (FAD)
MIQLLDYTEFPLQHMGKMASICWNTSDLTDDKLKKIGLECLESGHHRVAEFADITIEISEYSARMIRELYTHIIGVTRLQESTRYVDCSDFNYYIPDSIQNNEMALIEYKGIMHDIQNSYKQLQDLNIPKQDIANILPFGMHTKMVLKINLRALMHMAELRMCNRALKEYRDFMKDLKQVLDKVDDEWDYIISNYYLPKCEVMGYCIEKNSCGLINKKEDVVR